STRQDEGVVFNKFHRSRSNGSRSEEFQFLDWMHSLRRGSIVSRVYEREGRGGCSSYHFQNVKNLPEDTSTSRGNVEGAAIEEIETRSILFVLQASPERFRRSIRKRLFWCDTESGLCTIADSRLIWVRSYDGATGATLHLYGCVSFRMTVEEMFSLLSVLFVEKDSPP